MLFAKIAFIVGVMLFLAYIILSNNWIESKEEFLRCEHCDRIVTKRQYRLGACKCGYRKLVARRWMTSWEKILLWLKIL